MRWVVGVLVLGAMCAPLYAASWELSPEREVVLVWSNLWAQYSLSPDGRWFVLLNRHEFGEDAWKGICLWRTDDGEFQGCLTLPGFEATRGFLSPPIWSPDGSAFAVIVYQPGATPEQRLWAVYPGTGRVVELLSREPPDLYNLVWSPDGTRLALAIGDEKRGRIELFLPDAGEWVPVARYEGSPQWVFWTLGDRIMWGTVPPGDAGYGVFEVGRKEGGGPRSIWSSAELLNVRYPYVFSPDGRYLWKTAFPELIDLSSGKAIPLPLPEQEGYPKSIVSSLVWLPSGEQCLYEAYLCAGDQEGKGILHLLLGVPGREGVSSQILMERPPGYVLTWSADDRVWLARWGKKGVNNGSSCSRSRGWGSERSRI